jgi:phosphatidylserine/phosphatidylglycerophosphate/cardiolipin synthase-like enzyme
MAEPFLSPDTKLHLESPTSGSEAEHLLGGSVALPRMLGDIRSASGPKSFVYLASWNCQIDMTIPTASGRTDTLRSALHEAAAKGAEVRLLLWAAAVVWPDFVLGHPKLLTYRDSFSAPRKNNLAAEAALKQMKDEGLDAICFLDSATLAFGSHHQKMVIVGTETEVIAYVGGIEFSSDRISDVGPDGKRAKGAPLFDVSLRVKGPAAHSLLRTFADRWVVSAIVPGPTSKDLSRGIPLTRARRDSPPEPILSKPQQPTRKALLEAQVTHTYGENYPFSQKIQTAARAIATAIRSTNSFFYMEDQYFIGTKELTEAIRGTLRADVKHWGVVVIAAEESVTDLPDVGLHRRDFIRPLVNEFPCRFMVFERLGNDGTTTGPTAYVHSKLTIVDDVVAVVGSVNSSNRSWSHDSEVMLTLFDRSGPGGIDPSVWNSIRALRASIWQQHFKAFSTAGPPAPLGNADEARFRWQNIWLGRVTDVQVRPYQYVLPPYRISVAFPPGREKLPDAIFFTAVDPSG